jgi:hypothetical protein
MTAAAATEIIALEDEDGGADVPVARGCLTYGQVEKLNRSRRGLGPGLGAAPPPAACQ